MKLPHSIITAGLLALAVPGALAEEAGTKCEMCEMMKKKAAAQADQPAQSAELDKLVTEMNGSLGPKKIEAMAAVVTRLVEQYKALNAAKPAATKPQAEAHQH